MIKFIALMKRKAGMTFEAFKQQYESGHAPFAAPHMPRATHYERRFLTPLPSPFAGDGDSNSFDVLTEVWYEDRTAMEADFAGLADPQVSAAFVADEAKLFDSTRHRLFIVDQEAATDLDAIRA